MRPRTRNSSPLKPHDDLAELRRLLVRPEQEELRDLQERLDDKEQRAHEIADVLPEAVTLTGDRSEALTRALRPAVEGSVRESIEKRPEVFVEALSPIIGPVVRRSVAESLRGFLQSLNQTLEQSFSWQGLKWRFEALRTGRSFTEVVMLRSMIYQVEDLFLIHRESSVPLLHLKSEKAPSRDPEMMMGMLSAIQAFVRDTLNTSEDDAPELVAGDRTIWIALGRHAHLAAVIRGNPPRELRTFLQEAIERIHVLRGSDLAKFEGDTAPFESLRPELEPCLREQHQPKNTSATNRRAWFALALGAGLVVAALIVGMQKYRHWRDFVARLNAAPGVAVTQSNLNWFTRSRVAGLRDPAVADPAALARAAGVNPDRLQFQWKDYLALDDPSILHRFERRFGKPPATHLSLTSGMLTIRGEAPYEWITRVREEGMQTPGITSINEETLNVTYDPALALARFRRAFPLPNGVTGRVENGTLLLSGTAPYEWLEPVRAGAAKLPGISKVSEENLQVSYDDKLVLQRFVDRFNLPDSVNARVEKAVLFLAGEAPHAWLMRVRSGAPTVPGIRTIDERNLTDLDQRTFQQSKSVIESAFVYFLVNKDNFATEGFAALSRLPDEIRRCLSAANRLGLELQIEIQGYADSVGTETKNMELSQRRADAVKDFLVKCGFEPSLFRAMGLGAPPVTDKPKAEQSDRRVALKVVPKS